jgi:1-acyl-sn-glycerol-3-phosphate acyltransferase
MNQFKKDTLDGLQDGLKWFFNRAFRVHVTMPVGALDQLNGSMVMVVSTHRSQTDYFFLGWKLFEKGLKYLCIAAGDNLTGLPVIGKMFSSFGAFSVSRDLAFRKGYVRQLCMDVVAMLEAGDPILVFPEGGRSYGGNMMDPKGGILLAAIVAQARNPGKKVMLLPAAVSYEHLPELPYFDMLGKGKEMRKKAANPVTRLLANFLYFGADVLAFGKFMLRTRLGFSQGEAFIDIGTPFSLGDIVDIKANFNESAREELSGHQTSRRVISEKIYFIFQSLYRLLPEHAVAGVLKENPGATRSDAAAAIREMRKRLAHQGRNTKTLDSLTEDQIVAIGLKQLRHKNAVAVRGGTIMIKKQSIIDYYASALME